MSLLSGIRFISKEKREHKHKHNEEDRDDKHSKKHKKSSKTEFKEPHFEEVNDHENPNFLKVNSHHQLDTFHQSEQPMAEVILEKTATTQEDNTINQANQNVASLLRKRLLSTKGSLSSSVPLKTATHVLPSARVAGSQNMKLIEKYDDGDDFDNNYVNNIVRMGDRFTTKMLYKQSSSSKSGMNEEDDGDINMKLYENKHDEDKRKQLQLRRNLQNEEKLNRIIASCSLCSMNSMVIASGKQCYLKFKSAQLSLHKYHCEIIPIHHIVSYRQCEVDMINEIKSLQLAVVTMLDAMGLNVIFTETAMKLNKFPHFRIDCIPVEKGSEGEVSMYFKHALMSNGGEWSTNKKIIEYPKDKSLHRLIPEKVEYIMAEWFDTNKNANRKGLVHVLEDTGSVDEYFCLDIVGGMTGEDPIRIRSKMPADHDVETENFRDFKSCWIKYGQDKFNY